jgi:hypothetical protein
MRFGGFLAFPGMKPSVKDEKRLSDGTSCTAENLILPRRMRRIVRRVGPACLE